MSKMRKSKLWESNPSLTALPTTVLVSLGTASNKEHKVKATENWAHVVAHISIDGLSAVDMAMQKNLNDKYYLYVQRMKENAPGKLEQENPRFRFVPTLARLNSTRGAWKRETGHISPEMLSRRVGNLQDPIFYIAGPPSMVAAARRTLVDAAVDEDDIRTEEFAGY